MARSLSEERSDETKRPSPAAAVDVLGPAAAVAAAARTLLLLLLLLLLDARARAVLRRVGRLRLAVVDDRDRRGDRRGLVGDEARQSAALPVLDVRRCGAADDPRVLRAATLTRVHDELALRQRDPGESSREHPDILAVVDRERPQVGVPGTHPVLHERGDGREHDHRLRDPAARIGPQTPTQFVEFDARGVGTDDKTLAARSVDGLDDELVEPVEHLLERARILEPPRVDVLEDGLFGEVVADEVGNVGVDQLVIGDAVAHGVGDGDVAEPRGEHEAGRPEHRVRAELQWIEEVVVDTAVDDVDALGAASRAHEHLAADAEQVATLYELDAHQPGEQSVLEVGGVVHAGCQHDHVRVFDTGWCGGAERGKQLVRVVADRADAHRHEQLGQRLRHDAAVRDDVADARRHPHVVLEHTHLAVLVADQVDARHLDAHAVGAVDARGLSIEILRGRDQGRRKHSVAHAVLATIGVVEEGLECTHALLHTGLDPRPLVERDHAGNGIQGEGSLLAGEVERHTLCEVRARERLGATAQLLLGHLRERLIQLAVRLAGLGGLAGMRRAAEHLVECGGAGRRLARRQRGAVAVEQITHATTLVRGVLPACFGIQRGSPALMRPR